MRHFAAHRKAINDRMELLGYSERTRAAYMRELEKMSDYCRTAPDAITEEQIRDYLACIKTRLGAASLRMALHAVRFYLRDVLHRDFAALPHIRVPHETRLPDVLTTYEVKSIVESEDAPHHRTFFWTVYSLGLRLSEAINLQTADIDAGRRLVHIRRGKGARDRYVPLPSSTLLVLREYWRLHRHPQFLFPGTPHHPQSARTAQTPMSRATVQGAFRLAVKRTRLRKRASLHTLRHSYATHLLEAGVSLTHIQRYLGHRSLNATILYLHLTTHGQEYAMDVIEHLMR